METRWTNDSHNILEQASGLNNYNHWLMSNFSGYFGKSILEIGSGSGALSKLIPEKAIIVLSDIFPEYINNLKQIFTDPVLELDIEKEAPSDLWGKIDTILSSNVFEHLRHDQDAFNNCFKLLSSGGHLLLFVPARPEIYGKLDNEMGHFRRYTIKELRQKAEQAGFVVEKIYYSNFPGYFLWWGRGVLFGKIIKTKSGSSRSDSFFARVFDTFVVPLLYLEKFIHPPFGQSLVLVAKK